MTERCDVGDEFTPEELYSGDEVGIGMEDLTSFEVGYVDRSMDRHMHAHSISNNVARMTCGTQCRQDALAFAINNVLQSRREKAAWLAERETEGA